MCTVRPDSVLNHRMLGAHAEQFCLQAPPTNQTNIIPTMNGLTNVPVYMAGVSIFYISPFGIVSESHF